MIIYAAYSVIYSPNYASVPPLFPARVADFNYKFRHVFEETILPYLTPSTFPAFRVNYDAPLY